MKRIIFGLITALTLLCVACTGRPSPVSELTRIENESQKIVQELQEAMSEDPVQTEEAKAGAFGNYVRVSVTFREEDSKESDRPTDPENTERQNRTAASELCPLDAIESVSDSEPRAVVRVPSDTLGALASHPLVESVQLLENGEP